MERDGSVQPPNHYMTPRGPRILENTRNHCKTATVERSEPWQTATYHWRAETVTTECSTLKDGRTRSQSPCSSAKTASIGTST